MKASIIIRAYNAERTIERAVRSAFSQNFPQNDFEVIVVNDGSSDATRRILAGFESTPNLRIIDQENKGRNIAANRGLKESGGTYVILLDSDDVFESDLLRDLTVILDTNPGIDFVFPDYYENKDGASFLVSPRYWFEAVAVGILFRREKFAEAGFFRDLFFGEYDLFLRTIDLWKGYHHPKPLFTYFRRNESDAGDPGLVQRGIFQLKELHPDKINYIEKIRSY